MKPYPISYFSAIFSARKMVSQRKQLSLWQQIITTLFLLALLLIPTSLQIAQLKTYPLDNIISGVYDPLSVDVLSHLKTGEIQDGQLIIDPARFEKVSVLEEQVTPSGLTYAFEADSIAIYKDKEQVSRLSYKNITSQDLQSKKRLSSAISREWFRDNRFAASLFLMMTSAAILTSNIVFLLLGASSILFLISRTKFFDIRGFREAYTVVLHCLGLPTLLACLIGLMGHPVTTILLMQNMLFVLLLVWVFYKTQFKDVE